MDLSQVIKRPLITEKTTGLTKENKYSFIVNKQARKKAVRKAVEKFFKVKVKKVWLLNYKGKVKKTGRLKNKFVKKPDWKKAIVKLAKDDKIDLFDTAQGQS